jgi:hypothetical protein
VAPEGGDLFARDQQQAVAQRLRRDLLEVRGGVVVGDRQEVEPDAARLDGVLRDRVVAVAVDGVRVEVALVPAAGPAARRDGSRGTWRYDRGRVVGRRLRIDVDAQVHPVRHGVRVVDARAQEHPPLARDERAAHVAGRRLVGRDDDAAARAAAPAAEAAREEAGAARVEDPQIDHVVRLAGRLLGTLEVVGDLEPLRARRHVEGDVAERQVRLAPAEDALERLLLAHR